MVPGSFYQTPGADLAQGDIFRDVPHLFLQPPLQALRRRDAAGGRSMFGIYEYPPPTEESPGGSRGRPLHGGPFHFHNGELVSVNCRVAWAILLNHDCDIENDHDCRLVARIRPLEDPSIPHASREIIRRNGNYSYFYLPPEGELPASYVDFQRITSLTPSFIPASQRRLSLATVTVRALQLHFYRFVTHKDIGASESLLLK